MDSLSIPATTPVLCFFQAFYDCRLTGATVSRTDSKMIHVARLADMQREFELVMCADLRTWNHYRFGPRPKDWKLLWGLTPRLQKVVPLDDGAEGH